MHIEQLVSPADILKDGDNSWTALVMDLDLVEAQSSNPAEFVEAATALSKHAIVLVPPRLMHLEPQFANAGVFVLRKPTSSGEIALALRMLLKQSE